ncbi:MAG: hypothetical protein A2Y33_03295 [Spirochaetes bacterium GWF1_51_8]|nr:MAG: hypothetical protein A2Y33_03295 [Spirochaetes bacterium GWF1_51_8]
MLILVILSFALPAPAFSQEKPITNIPPLVLIDNPLMPWTEAEIVAVAGLIALLPSEYAAMTAIKLKKTIKPPAPGHSWKDKCVLDLGSRTIVLNLVYELPLPCTETNLYLGSFYSLSIDNPLHLTNSPDNQSYFDWSQPVPYTITDDPSAVVPTVQRLLLYALTRFLDNGKHLSDLEEWRTIGRFTGLDLLGNLSENLKVEGFACKEGMANPAEDLATFAVEFFLPSAYPDPSMHLINRLPAKYAYFSSLFQSKPDPQKGLGSGYCYSNWIDPADVDHIEILYATPVSSSIANLAGHIVLLIQKKGEGDVLGISKCLSFVANIYHYGKLRDEGLTFAFRGIFGGYPSMIQEETLAEVVYRARYIENRNLYRIKLVLSKEEIVYLIQRLWEMRNTYSTSYLFFNRNCGTLMVDMINEVFPAGGKVQMGEMFGMPNNLCAKLYAANRLGGFLYPEYWNSVAIARFAAWRNNTIFPQILTALAGMKTLLPEDVLRKFAGLFVTAVSRETNIDKASAYKELSGYYLALSGLPVFQNDPERKKEFLEIGRLLLKYLIYALDRERYLGPPDVLTKAKNNPEIDAVIKGIFSIRMYLLQNGADDPDPAEEIQQEFEDYAQAYREKGSYVSCANPLRVTLGSFAYHGTQYVSAGFMMGIQSQKMGEHGLFAMRNDVLLEVATYEFIPYASWDTVAGGFTNGGIGWIHKLTFLKLEQAIGGNDVDYNGWFVPSFGITLWEAAYMPGLGAKSDINVFDFSLGFCLFEANNFEHYINLLAGAGFSYLVDDSDVLTRSIDVKAKLDGKFYLFGNSQNILRFQSTLVFRFGYFFVPYWGFAPATPAVWRSEVSLSFGLGKFRDNVLTLGGYYEHKWNEGPGQAGFSGGETSWGIFASMKWDNFTLGIDLYRILNYVF